MSMALRLSLLVGVTLYMLILFAFLKNHSLSLKYSLIWIIAGVGMYICIIFPKVLSWIVGFLGIETQMYGLFVIVIFFLMLIVMSITAIVSRHTYRIRGLTQYIALLEKRVEELEEKKCREEQKSE